MQGFAAFRLLWAGQALALLGREASWFALTLFAYQKTGLATTLSLLAFFHFLPLLLFSPLAGALVDRWPRKRALFLSDLGGGVAAGFLLLLFLLGELQVFHLYLVSAFTGALSSLHWPALSASISAMLDKKDYARASGLLSLAESLAGIGGPILGAALLKPMGLGGVLLLELLGAVAAVTTLLLVAIPSPKPLPGPQLSLLQETLFGFRYILARPPLLGLQLMFFAVNFLYSLAATALPAMVLSKTAFSKVFAARRMIAWMANPLGMLLSGVLADRVFGPRWGQGEGIALMLLLFGGMGVLVGLLGYLIPVVREAEERLEDAKA